MTTALHNNCRSPRNLVTVRKHFTAARAVRREIQRKVKYLSVVKAYHAIYVTKDLLGDDLAASFQNEAEATDRLNIIIERGKIL